MAEYAETRLLELGFQFGLVDQRTGCMPLSSERRPLNRPLSRTATITVSRLTR